MNSVCKDLFKAVHEGKWLSIEYKNKDNKVTKYWIGVKEIDARNMRLTVDGLHLNEFTVQELTIYVDSILSTAIIEGTYCKINEQLVEDIKLNPHKYQSIFNNVPNLQILNYLSDCNRLDTTPYKCEYALINHLDIDSFAGGTFSLNARQFEEIVNYFQFKTSHEMKSKRIKQLAINVISINSKKGLYVLAYRRLDLDIITKTLRPADTITVCKEFTIGGDKQSIRQFLDAEDFALLEDIEKNLELIKDKITHQNSKINGVDDMPYLLAIGMDVILDLNYEYSHIIDMYDNDDVTAPIKAFFGDLTKRASRRKEYPLALLNRKVNLDQLLAINNAMKYPLAYIQGPPGTGKTNTIINTISTAFFNERTVLFTSYNNHPIDGVFDTLQKIKYRNENIPFPMIRLGNNEKVAEALMFMKKIYERTRDIKIYSSTLDKNRDSKVKRTAQLTKLLKTYEEILDLQERKETVHTLLNSNKQMNFQYELRSRQLYNIENRLQEIGTVTDDDALKLLADDTDEFIQYLYFTSAKYIKRLDEPKNKDLLDIIYMKTDNDEERVIAFNQYISDDENLKKFLRIFPIVATTCISAHKLGEPKPYFDMVIIDEASQCNTAISLVPILRGENLMLVGDPQQLNPVILLDACDNLTLRKKYSVSAEYDYISNSIYKTFLACDAISDEVLLSYHYRCHRRIIEFNNKKYYNNKLNIKSIVESKTPLVYVDVKENISDTKNTASGEAEQIVKFVSMNRDKKIGIITPFVNQKRLINESLKTIGCSDITCGTVHAFQGDEKDIILFSLCITDQTRPSTYSWLKNNKELINVATSRAREQLIVLANDKNLHRLHRSEDDDIYELVDYVKTNGTSKVTERPAMSRALGIKPYSTETEEAFLINLNHAIDNIMPSGSKYVIHKEVAVSHVFQENLSYNDLFYTGRFDFVVYERGMGRTEIPVLAIELDGKEHIEDVLVQERDQQKLKICQDHGFELIRVENSYARRYNYIKDILISYFARS